MIVLGRGRLGRSLAAAFAAAGEPVELRAGRDSLRETLPDGSLVFLAAPDPAVPDLARRLEGAPAAVVHLSGALTLDALQPHARRGAFHPYQSFPVERPPEHFEGALVGIDASDDDLLAELDRLAKAIGGRPRRVADHERALYHVSAVFASNYVVALGHVGVKVLEAAGWSRSDAEAAVRSLLGGVARNVQELGLEGSLIGPIRRGDPGTVRRHLAALQGVGLETEAQLYRKLGLAALELALEAGLEPEKAAKIEAALTG